MGNFNRTGPLPHTVSPDVDMIRHAQCLDACIDAIMGDQDHIPLSKSELSSIEQKASGRLIQNENDFVVLLQAVLFASLLDKFIQTLAHKLVQGQETILEQHHNDDAVSGLTRLCPNIQCQRLQQGFDVTSCAPPRIDDGNTPDQQSDLVGQHTASRTLLYSLLRGLDDLFQTSKAERIAWSEHLSDTLPKAKELGFFSTLGQQRRSHAHLYTGVHQPGDNDDGNRGRGGGGAGTASQSSRNSARGQARGGGQGRAQGTRRASGGRRNQNENQPKNNLESCEVGLSCLMFDTSAVMEYGCTSITSLPEYDNGHDDDDDACQEANTSTLSSSSGAASDLGSSKLTASTESIPTPPSSLPPQMFVTKWSKSPPSAAAPAGRLANSCAAPFVYHSGLVDYECDGTERYQGRSKRLVTQQWCTSACLAGLKDGLAMDPHCPNAHLHCLAGSRCADHSRHKHPLLLEELKRDLVEHLAYRRIVHIMEPILGCKGATSQLFRVVHPTRGYALAGKGSSLHDGESLHYEHKILEFLRRSVMNNLDNEGNVGPPILARASEKEDVTLRVPLCLGVIEPASPFEDVMYPLWPVADQVDRGHVCNTFLLLLYHGMSLNRDEAYQTLFDKVHWHIDLDKWCRTNLSRFGVFHWDLRPRNMLYCQQLQVVVVIDFEHTQK